MNPNILWTSYIHDPLRRDTIAKWRPSLTCPANPSQGRRTRFELPARRRLTVPFIHFSPFFQTSWRSTSSRRGRRKCWTRMRILKMRTTRRRTAEVIGRGGEGRGRPPTSSSPKSSASSTTTDTGSRERKFLCVSDVSSVCSAAIAAVCFVTIELARARGLTGGRRLCQCPGISLPLSHNKPYTCKLAV